MKKKYFAWAGIMWVLLILAGLYYYNKPHRSAAGLRADASLEAADLYGQFSRNESEANKKFMDKIITVKGKVTEVDRSGGRISILLDGGSAAGGVNCSFADSSRNWVLPEKGAEVSIKGRCSGYLMDVTLVDCVIER